MRHWLSRWRWRIASALVGALALTWLIGGYFVVVDPVTNHLAHADAIVVLGAPDIDGRTEYGLQLAAQGYAPVVAISVESPRQRSVKGACNGAVVNIKVLCFQAVPSTTQGEARQIRAYAQQYGWKSVIVVTSSYHVSRARLIVDRCFEGTVAMESPPVHHSFATMAYQYIYQTAGYFKAFLVTRGC